MPARNMPASVSWSQALNKVFVIKNYGCKKAIHISDEVLESGSNRDSTSDGRAGMQLDTKLTGDLGQLTDLSLAEDEASLSLALGSSICLQLAWENGPALGGRVAVAHNVAENRLDVFLLQENVVNIEDSSDDCQKRVPQHPKP